MMNPTPIGPNRALQPDADLIIECKNLIKDCSYPLTLTWVRGHAERSKLPPTPKQTLNMEADLLADEVITEYNQSQIQTQKRICGTQPSLIIEDTVSTRHPKKELYQHISKLIFNIYTRSKEVLSNPEDIDLE